MNRTMLIKFNAMLQLKLFKRSRSKVAGTMQFDEDGKALVWGFTPKIKHIDDVNKVYEQNKKAVVKYYKREN